MLRRSILPQSCTPSRVSLVMFLQLLVNAVVSATLDTTPLRSTFVSLGQNCPMVLNVSLVNSNFRCRSSDRSNRLKNLPHLGNKLQNLNAILSIFTDPHLEEEKSKDFMLCQECRLTDFQRLQTVTIKIRS